jgi:pimeloyl-ACP methyl ester carboxylesterase
VAGVVAVLIHGAGHTAAVWQGTQAALVAPSVAVDLPGRGRHAADITRVTVDEAARSVVADLHDHADLDDHPIVLVGHSVSGTVLPSIAAQLNGRVRRLVFVAGITAPEGQMPTDVFLSERTEAALVHLTELRERYRGQVLESIDIKDASAIDSLNFSTQPMRWAGVPASLSRTFVRCLRDPIQPRALQDQLIANCGADQVVDIDTGHTPAIDDPAALAAVLDRILSAAPSPQDRAVEAP